MATRRAGVSVSTISRSAIATNPDSQEAAALRGWWDATGCTAALTHAGEGLSSALRRAAAPPRPATRRAARRRRRRRAAHAGARCRPAAARRAARRRAERTAAPRRGGGGAPERATLAALRRERDLLPPADAKPEYASVVATVAAVDPAQTLYYQACPDNNRKARPAACRPPPAPLRRCSGQRAGRHEGDVGCRRLSPRSKDTAKAMLASTRYLHVESE